MKSWTDKSSAPLRRVKEILRFLKAEIDSGYAMFLVTLGKLQALAQQREVKN